MRKLTIIAILLSLLAGCEKIPPYGNTDPEKYPILVLDDPVNLSWHNCVYDRQDQIIICLDSVLGDSRCPKGVQCFWEGNAEVKFRFQRSGEEPIYFTLNTHRGFTWETVIAGYKITLVSLSPYPVYGNEIRQKDYRAEILVQKQK